MEWPYTYVILHPRKCYLVDKILQLVLLGQKSACAFDVFLVFEISLLSSLPGHETLLNCGFIIKCNIQYGISKKISYYFSYLYFEVILNFCTYLRGTSFKFCLFLASSCGAFLCFQWTGLPVRGLLSNCGAQASHCSGLSCCGAWALGHTGFSNCGMRA